MRRKIFLCVALSFCISVLSACKTGDGTDTSLSESTITETEMVSIVETDETTSGVSVEMTEKNTEKTEITEKTAETIASSVSVSTDSETVPSVTSEEETVLMETTAEIAEEKTETVTSVAETTAATTIEAVEKTTAATEKKPEVIIPDVKIPLADGGSAVIKENAEIDYSHADDGYISAVYNGGSKAAKLRVVCGDLQYDHDLAADGTREYFPLMGSGSYTVKVYELVTGKSYACAAEGSFEADIASETGMYLYPNKYSMFEKKSKCVKKAAELCAGKDDDVEKIAAIFEYVAENITYDKELAATVKSGYVPDPDKTLASGKGICFDYSSLMVAMCRSQGIPSRLVIGYAEPEIYHAWNEVYTKETGWITPELFFEKKGYNIADATFYAGNSNKKKIAGYISDDSNYSAMYRY